MCSSASPLEATFNGTTAAGAPAESNTGFLGAPPSDVGLGRAASPGLGHGLGVLPLGMFLIGMS